MTEVVFRSNMTVDLMDAMASDAAVVRAARVSTGAESRGAASDAGLIRFLMRERHGVPFEHCVYTFRVEAPIFVMRQLVKHRIASFSEESGRYRELRPVFYAPAEDRALTQVGKPGAYQFEPGNVWQVRAVHHATREAAAEAWDRYAYLLAEGVAREVARTVLPVSVFSSAYMTLNARSLMNLLSLRTSHDGAAYPSHPQAEIEEVAAGMEAHFARLQPDTYAAFVAAGRVAP